MAEDWSHRHLIFSSPTSAQQQHELEKQYRYWNQSLRRNARGQGPAADKALSQFAQLKGQRDSIAFPGIPNRNDKGSGGPSPIAAGSSALSGRQRPWAIYGIRGIFASLFLLAVMLGMKERRRRLALGFAVGIVVGFLSLQTGCASTNNTSTPQPQATQLMQRDWQTALTAGASVGEGMFPAKFTFNIAAAPSCANDFVVFTTGLAGSATAADIVAYNQLYSGPGPGICGAGGPSVHWAYRTTSAGGRTVTSPVLSFDGTQVAYVEGTGGTGVLHILRPATGGTPSAPLQPTPSVSAAAYMTCKATPGVACLFNINFGNGSDDSFSSAFYDYAADVLNVGDNGGNLHKFTGVFKGAPAEVTVGWPITINSTHALTGPVKDNTSGNIYVNDVDGTLWYVREVGSSVGTCSSGTPPCLGSTNVPLTIFPPASPPNLLVTDPPIVDSTRGRVFAFTGHGSNFPMRGANVFQADTALSAGSVIDVDVGQGDSFTLHSGAFDNAYFTSVATGHLYVCANSGANSGSGSGFAVDNQPTLKRISFNSNGTMMSSADAGTLQLTTSTTVQIKCSPVTEILNGSTDWMFMSPQASASTDPCAGNGCVESVSVPTASPFTFPAAISASLQESGGASGIVVDNISSSAQASSIYISILANSTATLLCNGTSGVGCAVKATQSGLK